MKSAVEPNVTGTLPPEDVVSIRKLSRSFTDAWLGEDADRIPDQIMELLLPTAVIVPHHGVEPRVGAEEIRAFWWPADVPPSRVTTFTITPHEIGGEGRIGFVRGRFDLAFVVEDQGSEQTYSNGGNSMMLVQKQPDGSWRISHHIWNDPLPQPLDAE